MQAPPPDAAHDDPSESPYYAAELPYYLELVQLLHPDGLACPRCGGRDALKVHRRARAPVVDYFCGGCLRVFNAWTGTVLQGTHRPPSHLFSILHAIVADTPTARLARKLGCQRAGLVAVRRRLIGLASLAAERGLFGHHTAPTPWTTMAGFD